MRTIKLIARFYYGIFLANFLVTLSCMGLMAIFWGSAHKIVGVLFWYKVISLLMIFYLAIHYQKKELYYYRNLGVSKALLGISTSAFDFLLWAGLTIVAW